MHDVSTVSRRIGAAYPRATADRMPRVCKKLVVNATMIGATKSAPEMSCCQFDAWNGKKLDVLKTRNWMIAVRIALQLHETNKATINSLDRSRGAHRAISGDDDVCSMAANHKK